MNFAKYSQTIVLPFVVDSAISNAFAPNSEFTLNWVGDTYCCKINAAGTELIVENSSEIEEEGYLEVCVDHACEWVMAYLSYHYSQENIFVFLRNNLEKFVNLYRLNDNLQEPLKAGFVNALSLNEDQAFRMFATAETILGKYVSFNAA